MTKKFAKHCSSEKTVDASSSHLTSETNGRAEADSSKEAEQKVTDSASLPEGSITKSSYRSESKRKRNSSGCAEVNFNADESEQEPKKHKVDTAVSASLRKEYRTGSSRQSENKRKRKQNSGSAVDNTDVHVSVQKSKECKANTAVSALSKTAHLSVDKKEKETQKRKSSLAATKVVEESKSSAQKKKAKKNWKQLPLVKGTNKTSADVPDRSDSTAQYHALEYLRTWKKHRKDWHFKKTRQVWLLQNMYDVTKVTRKDFHVLLEYLEGLTGKARQTTVGEAEKMLRDAEDLENYQQNANDGSDKLLNADQLERVREVVQILS